MSERWTQYKDRKVAHPTDAEGDKSMFEVINTVVYVSDDGENMVGWVFPSPDLALKAANAFIDVLEDK